MGNAYGQEKREAMIDRIEKTPYIFNYNPKLILPDSLGGKKYKGIAVVQGTIIRKCKVENIELMKLVLYTTNNDTLINYYFGKEYISSLDEIIIDNYLNYFKVLVNAVKIKKVRAVRKKEKWEATLLYRIEN